MTRIHSLFLGLALGVAQSAVTGAPAEFTLASQWEVRVAIAEPRAIKATVRVNPPALVTVTARYDRLPLFNPKAGDWVKGAQLRGVRAQETTTPGLLVAESLVLRTGPEPDSVIFERNKDYEVDTNWGTVGRATNSAIKADQAVFASYRHAQLRIDAVVLTRDGRIVIREGQPRSAAPSLPTVAEGERHLGNIWLAGGITELRPEHLFPILELGYPEQRKASPAPAERLLPHSMHKLQAGEHLRVLAWGDSVTDGRYVPDFPRNRWQEQFVARLHERYPKADIELVTEAWGGRNTSSYLNEPPGSPHNYRERVLGAKPDLIVSEFVNDAGLNVPQVEERYGKLLADFREIGAEWIILTPHYVRPDWMGLSREREIDEDPRPYVAGLNSINHPDATGMKIFADALMELIP